MNPPVGLSSQLRLGDVLRVALTGDVGSLRAVVEALADAPQARKPELPASTPTIPEAGLERDTDRTPRATPGRIAVSAMRVPGQTGPGKTAVVGELAEPVALFLGRDKALRGDDAQWHANGPSARPIHFPLIAPTIFRTVLAALGQHVTESGALDLHRLVATVACRRRVTRLPRAGRLGIGSTLVIIRDLGTGMIPFQPDMEDFVRRAGRQLGSERVRDTTIDERGWIADLEQIQTRSTVVILSDLQGFARRFSYGHTLRDQWLDLALKLRSTNSHALVLSPGGPSGQVPAPGFPGLFSGRRPTIGPVLPWDSSLTARRAAAFARRRHLADQRPAVPAIFEDHVGVAYRLLRLVALAHDIDRYTLRTLRLVLSDPQSLIRGYREQIDDDGPRAWRADIGLQPSDPDAGAFHEHQLWISSYVVTRGNIGVLSRRIEHLHATPTAGMEPIWSRTAAFAREALLRCRAGRGLIALLSDGYRWAVSVDRSDTEAAQAELDHFHQAARHIASLDGSARRLQRIHRGLLASPNVAADSLTRTATKLALRRSGDVLLIGVGLAGPDLEFPLKEGFDLQTGGVECWAADEPTKPVLSVATWPLPQRLALRRAGTDLRTVVARLGDDVYITNLDARRTAMKAAFTRRLDRLERSDTLRFDGFELVCQGRRFDPVGLRELGPEPAIEPVEQTLPENCRPIGRGPLQIWVDQDHTLYARRNPASQEISAITLPLPDENSWVQLASGQNGHAIVTSGYIVWVITADGDTAKVARWEMRRELNVRHAAASQAGGLIVESNNGQERRFHFFPAASGGQQSEILSAELKSNLDELAFGDTGLIALRNGRTVELHEPLQSLDSGQTSLGADLVAAATGAGSGMVSWRTFREYTRKWLPADDFKAASVLAALVSDDIDTLFVLRNAMLEGKGRPTDAQIMATTSLTMAQAALVADILALDTAAVAASAVPSGFAFPGSGLTPLHLACLWHSPGDLVRALLRLGSDPNAGDHFRRTPLFVAAYCNDRGLTLQILLDAGADPSLCGEFEGHRLGVLCPALYGNDLCAPASLIDRLLAGGADALAFGNSQYTSALAHAAHRGDLPLFQRILELDKRVDHQSLDGWSPLRMACHMRHTEIAGILLKSGATAGLSNRDGFTALIDAVHNVDADCAALLLAHNADANGAVAGGGTERWNPLAYLVDNAKNDATLQEIEAVACVLAKAGADPDRAPWPFRQLLIGGGERAEAALRGVASAGRGVGLVGTLLEIGPRGDLLKKRLASLLALPLDLDAPGPSGLRLLHLVAMHIAGDEAAGAFELLHQRGASIEAADDYGSTALHYACVSGNAAAARALMRWSPSLVDARRTDGTTPSHLAAMFGFQALAEELSGADPPAWRVRFRSLPSSMTLAQLSFLPATTTWHQLAGQTPVHRVAGGAAPAPLPPVLQTWASVLTRDAALPYANGRRLRETWWRRQDGVTGVSATVLDDKGTIVFEVNGTSVPIHKMNGEFAPRLETPDDAVAYLKFFCHAVHGDDGAFALCDTSEALLGHARSDYAVGTLPSHGVRASRSEQAQDWRVDATVRYGEHLFQAEFLVASSGMVEMSSDRPLLKIGKLERFEGDAGIYAYVPAPAASTGHES